MMRRVAVMLLGLVLSGCVPMREVTSYGVDARIVDAITQRPISGATVSLSARYGKSAARSTVSDAQGRAQLPSTEDRVWRPIYGDFYVFENIHVEAPGYASADVEAGLTPITVALQPKPGS